MTDNMNPSGEKNIPDVNDSEATEARNHAADPMASDNGDGKANHSGNHSANRRQMLMMGAVAASTIVAVRPAMAQSAGSVLNCTIRIPGPHGTGQNIAPDGTLVPKGTEGSFSPYGRRYNGEQIKRALNGRNLPGLGYEESRAYTNYVKRLQAGQSGFTCFASLQMPR